MKTLTLIIVLLLAFPALATEVLVAPPADSNSGEVRVPLSDYTALLQQLQEDPRPAPAAYAIGQSQVSVSVEERDGRHAARVTATLQIEIFENEWTLVPILPPDAALRQASVDGRPAQLVQSEDGLAWSSNKAGLITMQLDYGLDAVLSEAGTLLPIPIPKAAATRLTMTIPGSRRDLAVVPSADLTSREEGAVTRYSATIPATSTLLVTWRSANTRPYAISRAHYEGKLESDALEWRKRRRGGGRLGASRGHWPVSWGGCAFCVVPRRALLEGSSGMGARRTDSHDYRGRAGPRRALRP